MEQKKKNKEDKTLQGIIQDFLPLVSEGCIYVCTVCQWTWFRDQVMAVTQLH